MVDACWTGRMARKVALFSVALSALLVQVAECNYDALYDDYRNIHGADEAIVDGADITIPLAHPIYYYGQKYDVLKVTLDGTISFGSEGPVRYNRDPEWPSGVPEERASFDLPFVAPLHYQGYRPRDAHRHTGRIYRFHYHRREKTDTSFDPDHERFLDYLGKYLSYSSVDVKTFTPDLYVTVTWENVTDHNTATFNSSCTATVDKPCRSATFQVVIAADEFNTILIFNYAKMEIPYQTSYLAGMNGGSGRGWTPVVKCVGACLKAKRDRLLLALLPSLQGSSKKDHALGLGRSSENILGRFLFVVTNDTIVRGGCLPNDRKMGYLDTVEVSPDQVDMLGGQIIQVAGQCQEPYSTVYCRFDEQDVTEGKITAGMVGWCPVPRLNSRAWVKLEVSSNKNAWTVYTYIIAIPPLFAGRPIDDPAMAPWFQVNPPELRLSWDPSLLTTGEASETVDIVLVQYQESRDQVQWKDLVTLGELLPNSGTFRFNPRSDNRYTCENNCEDIELGLVEVRLSKDFRLSATTRRYIAIGPLPLGWYVTRTNSETMGEDWPRRKCERWAAEERTHQRWIAELPPCPCTLQQALADWGRWQADIGCNVFWKHQCAFNRKAKHCVRSVQSTASGAGSHCCYDNDNNLMYSGDSYEGSTSSRAHAWGTPPYNRAGSVPVMSHWLQDLVPYHHCCRWTNNEYCQHYTDRRPTSDCRHYWPPGSATIYGDPHVTTFDDESYHFGGAGDFWLVNSSHLAVQARFLEQRNTDTVPAAHNTYLLPTYISSVAIKGDANSDIVTFAKAPPGDLHPRRLDVRVNHEHYFFTDLPFQDFKGITVINNENYAHPARQDDREHSNFTVLVKSGAGVQVAERHGLLHVVVLLPPYKKDDGTTSPRSPESEGLLGTWDGKRVNEYLKPGGRGDYVPVGTSAMNKYRDFALKWAVESSQESLFQFKHHVTTTRNPRMDPARDYTRGPNKPADDSVHSECGSTDNPCAHDYYVTGNRTIAADTRNAQENFESLRRSQRKIWSCGWLDIPFAVKDHTNYSAGNTLRVTGCRQGLGSLGSVSGGPVQYTCVQNQTEHQPFWEPYEVNHHLCTADAEEANSGMIIGIVIAVLVVIAVVAVVAFLFYRRRPLEKSITVPTGKASARDDVTMDPGTDETLLKRQLGQGRPYRMSELQKDSKSAPV